MPKKKSKKSRPKIVGTVSAFNVSPHGEIEGVLVDTEDGVVQINFDADNLESVGHSLEIGAPIDVLAELETDEGAHPVYVVSEEQSEVTGTVARLNYSHHGEVNGCHLSDDTFVHVKPDRARKYKLRVGDSIKATGIRRAGPDAVVIDAELIEKE